MSICTPCAKSKTLASKSEDVIIGTAEENTDYILTLKRLTDDRVTQYEITSDNAGLITWQPEQDFSNVNYRITLSEASAPQVDVEFAVEGQDEAVTCIEFTSENFCVETQQLIIE